MSMFEFPHPKDKVVILKRIPVFAPCTDEQLLLIAERTRLLEAKRGELIYKEGEPADAFYIVISGRLRVFTTADGKKKTLGVLHNDDAFGEISLLTGEHHSGTVQALNDTLILKLVKSDFDEVINRIPSLVLYLSRLLSKRLRIRERSGIATEATIAAIYSATPHVGNSLFATALAAALNLETKESILVVHANENKPPSALLNPGKSEITLELPDDASGISEDMVSESLIEHPLGFRMLNLHNLNRMFAHSESIAPLLSLLIKAHRYVILDLPAKVEPLFFHVLAQSDLIFFVTDPVRDHVVHTKALLERLQSSLSSGEQPVHIVLNKAKNPSDDESSFLHVLFSPNQRMKTSDVAEQLNTKIDFTLPLLTAENKDLTFEDLRSALLDPISPFTITVRRIARKLSGRIVGLALGSGAALGLAHIGVLKVLEKERIPIDVVAGTSIGALIGGLWAAGKSAEELEQMAIRFKNPWNTRRLFLLDLSIPLPSIIAGVLIGVAAWVITGHWLGLLYGLISCLILALILGPIAGGPMRGKQLTRILEEDFESMHFEDTRLPVRLVASDPFGRQTVVFDSGLLSEAVRASTSIPGIFKPVYRQGKLCIDGGVLNPIPVNVLKQYGANRIIAVNVFPTEEDLARSMAKKTKRNEDRQSEIAESNFFMRFLSWIRIEINRSMQPLVFDLIMRSMQSMEHYIAEIACQSANMTLRPTLPDSYWLEFYNPEKFIQRGEEIALQHLPELKRLSGIWNEENPEDEEITE